MVLPQSTFIFPAANAGRAGKLDVKDREPIRTENSSAQHGLAQLPQFRFERLGLSMACRPFLDLGTTYNMASYPNCRAKANTAPAARRRRPI